MKEFKGKVAVITGSASGIGRGIAKRCGQEGMKVVLADVEEAALIQTKEELKAIGTTVLSVRTDVSKADDVEALAQQTLDAFGVVHVLFNNAGVIGGTTIWDSTLADWEWVINVNLWGVIHGVRVFVPIMWHQQTECHIVNTASTAGLTTNPGMGIYRMTKHAVVSLSETLYHELTLQNTHIGVSVLCPGFVQTKIFDAERNRPAELSNSPIQPTPTPEKQRVMQLFQEQVQHGMPPEQVADQVFEGIRKNKFYILTHPEYYKAIRLRMEDILQGRNPTPPQRLGQ